MIFQRTGIDGVWVLEIERLPDERGFFARIWDRGEFAKRGLADRFVQCSVSYNLLRGTLRGLHFQTAPHEEAKLVRCTAGAIFDVAVDLRPESPTYCGWFGVELSAENRSALYVPQGCAHGFLTLVDGVEVAYQISDFHAQDAVAGVRWDDPSFGIEWPADVAVINERDASYPDFAVSGRRS
jgi:dTDP-4-dehydrorhamnose 3,5-epimerase